MDTVPLRHRISSHAVNLIIIGIMVFLLGLMFIFQSAASQLEQLRFFVPYGNDVNLLAHLLPIRVGLGFVFLWYAIDNFQHPDIFNNLANVVLKKMHLEKEKVKLYPFAYIQSLLELFVMFSLVTGMYMDLGALIGSLLLGAVLFAYEEGLGSLLIRDVGLLGGTLSLFILVIVR